MNNQSKDKLFKITVVILGILIVIGLFGNIYLLLKKQKPPLPSGSESYLRTTPTQFAPSPTLAINKTTNKQLYKNKVFTLEFPLDWVVKEPYGEFLNGSGTVIFTPQSEIDAYGESPFITDLTITAQPDSYKVRYSLNTQGQFDEWLKKESSAGQEERLFKMGNSKIAGSNAVRFVSRTLPGDATESFYSIVTWFRKEESNYYFELGGNEKLVTKFTPTYNQILSTFKFLNPNTLMGDPVAVARAYLNAYINKDWVTAKKLSGDANFDEKIADSYGLTKYEIMDSKTDSNPNYFHVYIAVFNKSGTKIDKIYNNPLEVLMLKENSGEWKALTWYFFP